MISMASVVTNDGIFSSEIIAPLTMPTNPPAKTPTINPKSPNQSIPSAPRKAEKAKLEPIEISIDPVVTIINWAKARSNRTGVCCAINVQLRTDMNLSPDIAQNIRITSPIAMKGT